MDCIRFISTTVHVYLWRCAESARRTTRKLWRGLREWCGDAAYELYLRSPVTKCSSRCLSAREFYVDQLNRRYSRPNRCC